MGAEGTSNGEGAECGEEVQCFKSETMNNGFGFELGNDSGDGSSGGSGSIRTYKRCRQLSSSSKFEPQGDGGPSVDQIPIPSTDHGGLNGSNDHPQRQWRNVVLEHMYQLLSGDEGGIQRCIRDAISFQSENGFNMTFKEYDASNEDGQKHTALAGQLPKRTKNTDTELQFVMSNGSLKESNLQTTTEICQRVFFDVIISEKFTSLCKLLYENFEGIKVDSLFHLSLINSRMKNGAYEQSPVLFSSDIQQVWRKLQEMGSEIVSIAKSLSNISSALFSEQVGCSHGDFTEMKHELFAQEPDSHVKIEQTEACRVYKVFSCRQCGEKAYRKDCLVCDSCEEMYHVACIKPVVKEIPPKSWYCSGCTSHGMGSPHENCVICERLNASKTLSNNAVDKNRHGKCESLTKLEENSNCSITDDLQLSPGSQNPCVCKICGSYIKKGEKLRCCDHPYCPHVYYHVRCLTKKQLKSYCSSWYCPSCLCSVCLINKDDDRIVLCDGCDVAYHIYCMDPPRDSIPRGKWFCRKCYAGIQRIRRAKSAYQDRKNKLKRKVVGVGGSETSLDKEYREESDRSKGGVDMLLTAASTLRFEEDMAAAIQMKR